LARLLAKDPAARPSSARQIGAELERIAAQAGITPEIHTPPPLKDQAALGSELASRPRLASSTKVPNPTHKLSAAQKYAAAPRPTWLLPAFILLFSLGAILLLFLLLQVLAEDASPDEGGAREEVLIVRDPAATGEMAILVAQMAPLGEARPSVDRLILENLQQTLEGGAPELRLRVIPYPAVVSSEAQAAQIASANRAQMLIWGDYNEEFIEARLQVYAPQDRPAMQAAWLADMTHGRFRLYDERSDSLAAPVLAGLSHLYEYLGSPAATVMILSINAELNLAWPEVVGVDIGANVYRYHAAGLDSPAARAPLAEALRLDPRNPLLYYTQAIYERSQGQTAAMEAKLESAMRLSEEQWAMPYILRAQIALQTDDYPQAEAHLQEVLRIQPEDWYAHYSLGLIAYAQGERAAAKPHFRASAKDNTPFTITPNMFLALIALEEGQIEDFRLTSQAAMAEYGDPNTIRRVNRFFVDEAGLAATLMQNVFSVFANLVLGQHRAAGQDAVALILQQPDNPVFYLLAGVAACLDEDWPAAITAYNQSIALDGQNGFYYLLRGEAHRAQGDIGAALEDLSAAQAAPNWDSLAPAVNLDDPTPACERLSMLGDS
jgi:tetratricopeptide (TPR) repeat protein